MKSTVGLGAGDVALTLSLTLQTDKLHFSFITGNTAATWSKRNNKNWAFLYAKFHTQTQAHFQSFTDIGSYPRAIERPTATCLLKVEIKQPQKEDYIKHKEHSRKRYRGVERQDGEKLKWNRRENEQENEKGVERKSHHMHQRDRGNGE